MKNNSERRLFFKHLFTSASDFLSPFVSTKTTGQLVQSGDLSRKRYGMSSQIMGDLTPELLAMEAERLGLDPQKDHHRIIQSVQAAMGGPDRNKGCV
jgi:hypothetical protein